MKVGDTVIVIGNALGNTFKNKIGVIGTISDIVKHYDKVSYDVRLHGLACIVHYSGKALRKATDEELLIYKLTL